MRLTNAMRETASEYIVNKVYPTSNEEKVRAKILETLDGNKEWKTMEMLAEKYPNYVKTTKNASFQYGDYYIYLPITLKKPVAFPYYELRFAYREDRSSIYCKEFDRIGREYTLYLKEKDDYKDKVKRIVLSCNTTKQLYEAIPEIDGYFGKEEKHMSVTAIVPQALIDEVRAMIPQEKEADNE